MTEPRWVESDYCPTCGHRRRDVLYRCIECGLLVRVENGFPGHLADHRVAPGPDGTCGYCGRPTKVRSGRIGHVFDHPAVIEDPPFAVVGGEEARP